MQATFEPIQKSINMSSLMHLMVENYNELLEREKDPSVDSWLFMESPVPVISIALVYLYFVLKLGPKLMQNRPAFTLKSLLVGYNAYQVLFSVWLCGKAYYVKNDLSNFFSKSCRSSSSNTHFQRALTDAAWWYFFSKVVELLDTVFFVLRKKQSQVTFLHVYHHTCTMLFSWGYLKYLPGEQGIVIGFLNSFVHVVMYSYYLIAALGPKYQKYLWWKKYMTKIQLIQFCIMILYLSYITIMDCKLPKSLTYFFVGNAVIYLYLFGNFYRKSYIKSKNPTNDSIHTSQKLIKSQ